MIKKINKPELVSPAGDWPSLYSAIDSGADGIYFGVRGFNMRAQAVNFDKLEIKKIMQVLHKSKKKGYLAINTIFYDNEINKLKSILREAKKNKVDAVIAWDMAVIELAKKSGLRVHLSTQASVSNFESLKFYASLGVKRVVLARECSLSQIKEIIKRIKKEKIDCDIEVFIHGAMCVSISGRCFLSGELFAKSANRGECIQPCRREYVIQDVETKDNLILGKDYILSAKDLCTIDFIDELIRAGITAFKIEGRMRPPEYISVVTDVYRQAIDRFFCGRLSDQFKKGLKEKLKIVFNRGYTDGFYLGQPRDLGSRKGSSAYDKIFIGQIKHFYNRINVLEMLIRNENIKLGDKILIFGKTTPANFVKIEQLQIHHKPVTSAEKGDIVGIKIPFLARLNDKVFLWRKKPSI